MQDSGTELYLKVCEVKCTLIERSFVPQEYQSSSVSDVCAILATQILELLDKLKRESVPQVYGTEALECVEKLLVIFNSKQENMRLFMLVYQGLIRVLESPETFNFPFLHVEFLNFICLHHLDFKLFLFVM